MASSSASESKSAESCDIPCVPALVENNSNTKVECDKSLLSDELCFKEKDVETAFFDALDWGRFVKNIQTYKDDFADELNNDEGLAKRLQAAYKFGPIENAPKATTRRYALIGVDIVENDDFKKCNNIILRFYLDNKRSKPHPISHISLHSRFPTFYRDDRRSLSGCGYMKRGAPLSASTASQDDYGPFHYQIDTLYWKHPRFEHAIEFVPFMKFEPDPRNPGFFQQTDTNFRNFIGRHRNEIKLNTGKRVLPPEVLKELEEEAKQRTVAAFQKEKPELMEKAEGEVKVKKSEFSARMLLILKALKQEALEKGRYIPDKNVDIGSLLPSKNTQIEFLNDIHKTIAKAFLQFWNGKILPGYEENPPILISALKSVGLPILNTAQKKSGLFDLDNPIALRDENVVMDLSTICRYKHVYSGYFIQNEVANKLFMIANDGVPPEFKYQKGYQVQAGHVTMAFKENTLDTFFSLKDTIYENPIGLNVTHIVYGKVNGKPFVAVQIELPPSVVAFSKNRFPHITMFHHPSLKPEMANDLLEGKENITEKGVIPLGMGIPGFTGVFTGATKPAKGGTRKLVNKVNTTRRLIANKHE